MRDSLPESACVLSAAGDVYAAGRVSGETGVEEDFLYKPCVD